MRPPLTASVSVDTPDPRARAWTTVVGVAPVVFAVGVVVLLLWGLGYQVPLAEAVDENETTTREAAAWAAGVILFCLAAGLALPVVERLLRGRWSGPIGHGPFGAVFGRLPRLLDRLATDRALVRKHRLLPKPSRRELTYDTREHAFTAFVALNLMFPTDDNVRPTTLGNVLAAVRDRIVGVYDLDLRVVWSRLFVLVSDSDQLSLLRAERVRNTNISLAAGWALATAVTLALSLGYVDRVPLALLASAGAAVLALRAYRAAIAAALEHGRAVEAAVDIYLERLLMAMGFPPPKSYEELRMSCAELSRLLAVPGGHVERFRAAMGTGVDSEAVLASIEETVGDAVATTLKQRLGSGVSQAVQDAVPEALDATLPGAVRAVVPQAIQESVQPAVAHGVREAISGPVLANFHGWVSVTVLGPDGVRLPIDPAGRLRVNAEGTHQVTVTIGPEAVNGRAAGLNVTGGERRPVVDFDVVLDSDRRALRQDPVAVPVSEGETVATRFEFDPLRDVPDDAFLWVRVFQRRRLLQTVDLIVEVGDDE